MKGAELAFLTLGIGSLALAFASLLFVGFAFYQKKNEKRFSLLCDFPFELAGESPNSSPLVRSLVIVFCLADIFCLAFPLLCGDRFFPVTPLCILALSLSLLKSISLIGVFFVPAHRFKLHLLCFLVFAMSSCLLAVSCASAFLNLQVFHQVLGVAFAVVEFALGFGLLASLLNPRLAHWTEMNLEVGEDGSMNPVRPRPFPLAFTQWFMILVNLATTVSFLVGLALIILTL